jgi:hypothetical protein
MAILLGMDTEDKIRCTGCDEFFSPDDIVFIWNDEKLCEECDVKRINKEFVEGE